MVGDRGIIMRKAIDDSKVINIWEGTNEDGETYTVEVTPDWYADNGTPVDMCGEDMVYVKTEIDIS